MAANLHYIRFTHILCCTSILSSILVLSSAQSLHAQDDRSILSRCDSMIMDADTLSYIEKQLHWRDAQRQVSVYEEIVSDSIDGISIAYYTQLIRMLVYMDPFKSMDVHRPYMAQLDSLTHGLSSRYQYLKWYAYRKLSQLYALDNRQLRAYKLLEEIVQGVHQKALRDSRDTLYLTKAMVGQLFCYDALPKQQGCRNQTFLRQYSNDNRIPLGLALYCKRYSRIITLCDSLLQCDDMRLVETYSLLHYKAHALQHSPSSLSNAQHMFELLDTQSHLYRDVREAIDYDYKKYQDYQEKSRLASELEQAQRQAHLFHLRVSSIVGLFLLLSVFLIWMIYHYESIFEENILQQVQSEKDRRQASLQESQKAYDSQVQLVRNLNHDIRVPLNALLGYAYLLSSTETTSPEDQAEARTVIRTSSDSLLDMINNLLSIARLETNKMSIHKHPTPVSELLRLSDWDSFRAKLLPGQSLTIDTSTCTTLVDTDYGHVLHILKLIVRDIARQTDNSHITLSIDSDHPSGHVCVCVIGPLAGLSLTDMHDALDSSKRMSDYEDASSYYLVLARMITHFIGAQLELHEQGDNVQFNVLLPTTKH